MYPTETNKNRLNANRVTPRNTRRSLGDEIHHAATEVVFINQKSIKPYDTVRTI
jgi:hypothetical protein